MILNTTEGTCTMSREELDAHDELLARAVQALKYLDHPDVQAIGFVIPASIMAKHLRTAIGHNEEVTK